MLKHRLMETNNGSNAGGSPAPSAPAPAASPAPSSSSNDGGSDDSSFDFGSLGHDENPSPAPTSKGNEAPPATPPAAQPPAAPASAPAAAVAPPAAPVATPPSPPATPPAAPAAAPEAASPAPTEAPVEQIDFEKHRQNFLPKLQELYKLTEAEAEQLRADPASALPVLAAKLHYEVQMSLFNSVMQALPAVFNNFSSQQTAAQKANEAFYSKWGALKEFVAKNPASEDVVRNSIKAYRAANPKASMDDVIANAGLLAMMTLKIPLEAPTVTPPAPGSAPAVPAPGIPARPPGIAATGHIPSAPAGNGAPGDESNIFAEIAEDFLRG